MSEGTGEQKVPQPESEKPGTPAPGEGTSEHKTSQQTQPAEPSTLMPGDPGVVRVRPTPSQAQVVRAVADALLAAEVVLGALSARAGTNFRRLVRHRPLPGGHAHPALGSSTGNMGFRCMKEV